MWHIQIMLPAGYIAAVVFIFGLIFGSFLNVCISRLPTGKSIVRPASSCPKCGKPIRAYDNIPVLSYLLLMGKCRNCKARISPVYPAVELLTGTLFLLCYLEFGNSVLAAKWAAFSAILVVLIFTDWRERILPDKVNLLGFILALVFCLMGAPVRGIALNASQQLFAYAPPARALSFVNALIGALVGSGVLLLVPKLYFWSKGVYLSLKRGNLRLKGLSWQKGMGMGDIKMMAMVGAYLGVWMTILTILIGSLLGSVLGLLVIAGLFVFGWKRDVAVRANRMGLGNLPRLRLAVAMRYQLPFGTYLGAAALLVIFFGTPVVTWYQSLFLLR